MTDAIDAAKQLENQLAAPNQAWLLGAGASFESQIPLISLLTTLVKNQLETNLDKPGQKEVVDAIFNDLPPDSNIELFLTHLTDFISLSERSHGSEINVLGHEINSILLSEIHREARLTIRDIIRFGATETETGSRDSPIIKIEPYLNFIRQVLDRNQDGLQRRRGVTRFYTLNYDTLLEDALAIGMYPYDDGFLGGAVAYWSPATELNTSRSNLRAIVRKLHGSIDWWLSEDQKLMRVRPDDRAPLRKSDVLIYPQSSKYTATQRDPFSALFKSFRDQLNSAHDNVLCTCGYSFGDEHVNNEIESGLANPTSKTTMLVFAPTRDGKLPGPLEDWRNEPWGERLYFASDLGLYRGSEGPFFPPNPSLKRDWWTLSGLTKILESGLPEDILEQIQ